MHQHINIQEQTVIKARGGDPVAQSDLYKQYSKAMYNICLRMTGNKPDADDVFQDAFIHAFANLKQVREPAAFAGWLRRLVVNRCILQSKRHFRWNDLDDDFSNTMADESTDWWKEMELQLVHEEIKNLPNGCRQVFLLFVLEDYSHRAIAESLDISESTSKSQYQRARKLLRERITKKISIDG